MAKLLLRSATPTALATTRMGGPLLAPAGFQWPCCATCAGPMQFFMHIRIAETGIAGTETSDKLLLLFQCQNQPGLCDEWDPNARGNQAILVDNTDLVEVMPPLSENQSEGRNHKGPTTVEECIGVTFEPIADSPEAYGEAYSEHSKIEGRSVVGKFGGQPQWLQADESDSCQCSCGANMVFLAQLEEVLSELNFGGGGIGYCYACFACWSEAKFLWQC